MCCTVLCVWLQGVVKGAWAKPPCSEGGAAVPRWGGADGSSLGYAEQRVVCLYEVLDQPAKKEYSSVVKFLDHSLATTMLAIVWSTENCNYILVTALVTCLRHQLMSSGPQREAFSTIKCLRNVLAEDTISSPRRYPQPPWSSGSNHSKSYIGPS